MNKSAGFWVYDAVIFIMRVIFVIALIIVYLMFEGIVFKTDIDVKKGETYLMINALMTSPNGFSYVDNGRLNLGIIDTTRFDELLLNNSFFINLSDSNDPSKELFWAYNLSLYDFNHNLKKRIIWNSYWYNKWKVLAKTGLLGFGSAFRITQEYFVTIKDGSKFVPGYLVVDVVRPSK